ncbi:right-handed parallel beta-helix repeat-containing protein [Cellulomonas persica]|uniref:Right handed beta helix domain-containing protein n=1 Tax=Cellulomonas persica TaxID=76861 RepID=A0A510USW4_9CELL|nr:right-handed parallel beta-helix repeat-containing protein [Cellulomonas persica]GEK17758.1 hypothetical protein CPE01_14910 [Cellulomonas persica]
MPDIHVTVDGSDSAQGTPDAPLRTISRAARLARPGDTVVVHEGEYREWVRPARGGLSDERRITYTAAPGEHVVVKGSERVTGWEPDGGTVWRVRIPNTLFGEFNPFVERVEGDWAIYEPGAPRKHLADVYLDGRSFYEVHSRAEVHDPVRRDAVLDVWTGRTVPTHEPEQTVFVWYAEVDEDGTTVWANFHGADPNDALVEVNVRRSVFYPDRHHLDWITVRGFELAHAATPWAPPTADQPGLIGPNWAKGWIIEDNLIHDAKCSAVSLGKEASTGDNYSSQRGDKPGYQYQLESVFAARHIGWDREHIGSHVVRRNTIVDCGQTGVVGHLGCVFSTIEDNHIHRIALKREFFGHEIAGIKLHAAIDTQIRHNRIHDASLGIWLDWQTQGTRVSRNLLYDNNRDLFVEVSHGPYVVDHNVLASAASVEVVAQGGAYVSNLVGGTVRLEPVPDRSTPYHVPHSTQVAGYAVVEGGDDRWVGNLFLGGDVDDAYAPGGGFHRAARHGTAGYDEHPTTSEEYRDGLDPRLGDHARYRGRPLPVQLRDNVYANGAEPFRREVRPQVLEADDEVQVTLADEGDEVFLEITLPEGLELDGASPVDGAALGFAHFPDAAFEHPDGSVLRADVDLVGTVKSRDGSYPAGPLADLRAGLGRVRVW